MLSLFRNNQFFRLAPLAGYVVLLRLPALLGWVAMPETALGGCLGQWVCGFFAGQTVLSALAAAVLVFWQGFLVNRLDNEFRLAADRTWFPAVFYVLTVSLLTEFLFISPVLLAATVLPMILQRIFSGYKQQVSFGSIFDVGFLLALGSLFYAPFLWMLVPVLAGIGMLRSFNFRERLVLLAGVFAPLFLAWLWFFWRDSGGEFWQTQFGQLFHWPSFDLEFGLKTCLQLAMLAVFVVVALLNFGSYTSRKSIQVQKFIGILFWFLFAGGLTVFTLPSIAVAHFLLLASPLGIFLALTFLNIKNRALAEVLHLLLVGSVLALMLVPLG